ncbi:MAG: hypothetical protein RBT80_26230 [Candidatus Vecturithrix sp.]|jgi:hypothetical protein|nr:hypothetical protein [Candidatus Vecturithrix sp.]
MNQFERKKKKLFILSLIVVSLVFLVVFFNVKNVSQEQRIGPNPHIETEGIYRKFISGREYCVPRSYLRSGSDDASESLLLYLTFPEMTPDQDNYYSHEDRYKKLKILIHPQKDMRPLEEVVVERKRFLQVELVPSDTKGLTFFKQSEDSSNDGGDLYTEEKEGKLLSYISCGKVITNISVPQCVQSKFHQNLSLQITYDKDLLQEWKSIEDKAIDLIDNFKCK